jgi:glycerol-3-phosphate dehydrogenase
MSIMPIRRSEMIKRLAAETYDLLVVGGGITGVGIAQDAAYRGLKVALVEKGDFASGTSHASTKLLHGGLRYLEHFEFKLMYEALHERNRLTRLAPHLAEWVPFLIPIYGAGWKMEKYRYGLWVYDLLAGWPKGATHRRISREEALTMAPHLKPEGLRGAYLYYDCRTNDTRLTVEVLTSALKGGAVAANYCKVTGLVKERGQVVGAHVADARSGETFMVRATSVVNATGPWADQLMRMDRPANPARLAPSKGVHIVVPADRLPVEGAVLAPSQSGDGRFIFVVPWQGAVLLGTTDTPWPIDPDLVRSEEADIHYILAAANGLFPNARLTRADVISAIAGLRPLIKADKASTDAMPREHKIWVSDSGLITMAGGKLTTYRTMAAEVVDLLLKRSGRRIPCRTAELPLGQERARGLANLVASHPDLAAPLVEGLPYTRAEVVWAAREEMAITPDDFLDRRSRLALLDRNQGEGVRKQVADLLDRFNPDVPHRPASPVAI